MQDEKPLLKSKTIIATAVALLMMLGQQFGVPFVEVDITGIWGTILTWVQYLVLLSIAVFRAISTQKLKGVI